VRYCIRDRRFHVTCFLISLKHTCLLTSGRYYCNYIGVLLLLKEGLSALRFSPCLKNVKINFTNNIFIFGVVGLKNGRPLLMMSIHARKAVGREAENVCLVKMPLAPFKPFLCLIRSIILNLTKPPWCHYLKEQRKGRWLFLNSFFFDTVTLREHSYLFPKDFF